MKYKFVGSRSKVVTVLHRRGEVENAFNNLDSSMLIRISTLTSARRKKSALKSLRKSRSILASSPAFASPHHAIPIYMYLYLKRPQLGRHPGQYLKLLSTHHQPHSLFLLSAEALQSYPQIFVSPHRYLNSACFRLFSDGLLQLNLIGFLKLG